MGIGSDYLNTSLSTVQSAAESVRGNSRTGYEGGAMISPSPWWLKASQPVIHHRTHIPARRASPTGQRQSGLLSSSHNTSVAPAVPEAHLSSVRRSGEHSGREYHQHIPLPWSSPPSERRGSMYGDETMDLSRSSVHDVHDTEPPKKCGRWARDQGDAYISESSSRPYDSVMLPSGGNRLYREYKEKQRRMHLDALGVEPGGEMEPRDGKSRAAKSAYDQRSSMRQRSLSPLRQRSLSPSRSIDLDRGRDRNKVALEIEERERQRRLHGAGRHRSYIEFSESKRLEEERARLEEDKRALDEQWRSLEHEKRRSEEHKIRREAGRSAQDSGHEREMSEGRERAHDVMVGWGVESDADVREAWKRQQERERDEMMKREWEQQVLLNQQQSAASHSRRAPSRSLSPQRHFPHGIAPTQHFKAHQHQHANNMTLAPHDQGLSSAYGVQELPGCPKEPQHAPYTAPASHWQSSQASLVQPPYGMFGQDAQRSTHGPQNMLHPTRPQELLGNLSFGSPVHTRIPSGGRPLDVQPYSQEQHSLAGHTVPSMYNTLSSARGPAPTHTQGMGNNPDAWSVSLVPNSASGGINVSIFPTTTSAVPGHMHAQVHLQNMNSLARGHQNALEMSYQSLANPTLYFSSPQQPAAMHSSTMQRNVHVHAPATLEGDDLVLQAAALLHQNQQIQQVSSLRGAGRDDFIGSARYSNGANGMKSTASARPVVDVFKQLEIAAKANEDSDLERAEASLQRALALTRPPQKDNLAAHPSREPMSNVNPNIHTDTRNISTNHAHISTPKAPTRVHAPKSNPRGPDSARSPHRQPLDNTHLYTRNRMPAPNEGGLALPSHHDIVQRSAKDHTPRAPRRQSLIHGNIAAATCEKSAHPEAAHSRNSASFAAQISPSKAASKAVPQMQPETGSLSRLESSTSVVQDGVHGDKRNDEENYPRPLSASQQHPRNDPPTHAASGKNGSIGEFGLLMRRGSGPQEDNERMRQLGKLVVVQERIASLRRDISAKEEVFRRRLQMNRNSVHVWEGSPEGISIKGFLACARRELQAHVDSLAEFELAHAEQKSFVSPAPSPGRHIHAAINSDGDDNGYNAHSDGGQSEPLALAPDLHHSQGPQQQWASEGSRNSTPPTSPKTTSQTLVNQDLKPSLKSSPRAAHSPPTQHSHPRSSQPQPPSRMLQRPNAHAHMSSTNWDAMSTPSPLAPPPAPAPPTIHPSHQSGCREFEPPSTPPRTAPPSDPYQPDNTWADLQGIGPFGLPASTWSYLQQRTGTLSTPSTPPRSSQGLIKQTDSPARGVSPARLNKGGVPPHSGLHPPTGYTYPRERLSPKRERSGSWTADSPTSALKAAAAAPLFHTQFEAQEIPDPPSRKPSFVLSASQASAPQQPISDLFFTKLGAPPDRHRDQGSSPDRHQRGRHSHGPPGAPVDGFLADDTKPNQAVGLLPGGPKARKDPPRRQQYVSAVPQTNGVAHAAVLHKTVELTSLLVKAREKEVQDIDKRLAAHKSVSKLAPQNTSETDSLTPDVANQLPASKEKGNSKHSSPPLGGPSLLLRHSSPTTKASVGVTGRNMLGRQHSDSSAKEHISLREDKNDATLRSQRRAGTSHTSISRHEQRKGIRSPGQGSLHGKTWR